MNNITALDSPAVRPPEDDSRSVTLAVVTAVADAKGVSPVDLTTPLYAAVDTDALDQFVDGLGEKSDGVEISFQYCGFDVTVSGDGSVALD